MIVVGLIVLWLVCGAFAYAARLADSYSIGVKFPLLGTPDEQWRDERWWAMPVAILAFVAGPIGPLSGCMVTGGFRTGFRWW